ncbi:hypothetical protein LguiA_025896 [Lonicera macranthoides]
MSIIIFSETYASSKACLEEVATILEHSKKSRHQFLSVFYHVEPAYIKDQALKGLPGVSATKENKKRWSMALKEVASIAGMHLKNHFTSQSVQAQNNGSRKVQGSYFMSPPGGEWLRDLFSK